MAAKPTTEAGVEAWVKGRFGYAVLKEGQAQIILGALQGRRQLFVAPTGHGKSLCYQALAANPWSSGVVLVFQPLKALMAEQVQKARDHGLRAELINSDLDRDEQEAVLAKTTRGEVDILFLAPERQGNALWQDHIGSMNLKGVVIDEAHCISQWGHDFRPWYRRLVETTMGLGLRTPVLAVTATAPTRVVADIRSQIEDSMGRNPNIIRLPSYRPNIACASWPVTGFSQRLADLVGIVKTRCGGEAVLAYTLTTEEAQAAAEFLRREGIQAVAYTGQMDIEEKQEAMHVWQAGRAQVMCATTALGMGLDRQDLHYVVHLGLPDSLIRYVQEIGRVGRDGKPSFAIALHDTEAQDIYEWMVSRNGPSDGDYRLVLKALLAAPRSSRTELEAETDIHHDHLQTILDRWMQNQWVVRHDSKPYEYEWTGGPADPVPAGLEEASKVRAEFLKEVMVYAASGTCRPRTLAQAMQDAQLPAPCGVCDRCATWTRPDASAAAARASRFLAKRRPDIKMYGKQPNGKALAQYGVGPVGEAVRDAKQNGHMVPDDVVADARSVVLDSKGPYAGVSFDAVVVVPSTTSGDFVSNFGERLAAALGVPCVRLVKTRTTKSQKSFRSNYHKKKNVDGAFALEAGAPRMTTALLVDDIWHTGSTMQEASRTLRPVIVYPLVMVRTKRQT